MAFRDVDPGPLPDNDGFIQFNMIGDRMAGVFVSHEERPGNFEKPDQNYTFRTKEGVKVCSAPFDLHRHLQHAKLQPGWRVIATYIADKANPQKPNQKPMKLFKVQVDDSPAAVAVKPPPPPVTAADPFEGL